MPYYNGLDRERQESRKANDLVVAAMSGQQYGSSCNSGCRKNKDDYSYLRKPLQPNARGMYDHGMDTSKPLVSRRKDPFSTRQNIISSARTSDKKHQVNAYMAMLKQQSDSVRKNKLEQTYDHLGRPMNDQLYSDQNTRVTSGHLKEMVSYQHYNQNKMGPYETVSNILYAESEDPMKYDPHDPMNGAQQKKMFDKYAYQAYTHRY
jgi:hypothetical protein